MLERFKKTRYRVLFFVSLGWFFYNSFIEMVINFAYSGYELTSSPFPLAFSLYGIFSRLGIEPILMFIHSILGFYVGLYFTYLLVNYVNKRIPNNVTRFFLISIPFVIFLRTSDFVVIRFFTGIESFAATESESFYYSFLSSISAFFPPYSLHLMDAYLGLTAVFLIFQYYDKIKFRFYQNPIRRIGRVVSKNKRIKHDFLQFLVLCIIIEFLSIVMFEAISDQSIFGYIPLLNEYSSSFSETETPTFGDVDPNKESTIAAFSGGPFLGIFIVFTLRQFRHREENKKLPTPEKSSPTKIEEKYPGARILFVFIVIVSAILILEVPSLVPQEPSLDDRFNKFHSKTLDLYYQVDSYGFWDSIFVEESGFDPTEDRIELEIFDLLDTTARIWEDRIHIENATGIFERLEERYNEIEKKIEPQTMLEVLYDKLINGLLIPGFFFWVIFIWIIDRYVFSELWRIKAEKQKNEATD